MTGGYKTASSYRAIMAATMALLCLSAICAQGQRFYAPRFVPVQQRTFPPRRQARPRVARPQQVPQNQFRPAPQAPYQRPAGGGPYPGQGPEYARPANPNSGGQANGSAYPNYSRPGHLGDWLNQHRSVPVQDQERILRSDPSFNRLAPAEQQRVMRQLQQVNQLPDEQRQRRLARAEALERLTPQDRMQANLAMRRLLTLPPDRQQVMRRAFRDLRSVPLDERETVLNSRNYQGVFTPEERGILTNVLRAEPYEPAQ